MTGTYSEEILNNLKKHDFNVEFSVLKHAILFRYFTQR